MVTFLCVQPNDNYNPDADDIAFPRQNGIRDASLVLLKEKSGRISLLRVSDKKKMLKTLLRFRIGTIYGVVDEHFYSAFSHYLYYMFSRKRVKDFSREFRRLDWRCINIAYILLMAVSWRYMTCNFTKKILITFKKILKIPIQMDFRYDSKRIKKFN